MCSRFRWPAPSRARSIEATKDDTNSHPVGTGPLPAEELYALFEDRARSQSRLSRKTWDFTPGDDPLDRAIAARMTGKKLPQIERVEISIMEETQSRWLAFLRGDTDYRIPALRGRADSS